MDPSELFIVEWSANEQAFHIQPLIDALKSNLNAMKTGLHLDYIPVAVTNTRKEAGAVSERLELLARPGVDPKANE